MKKTFGVLCMLLGAVLVFGALALFLTNEQKIRDAELFTKNVLPEIRSEILQEQDIPPTEPENTEYTPVELLEPEDLIMTEKVINGYAYIGYLTIPDLDLELPVMSSWDYALLQISPCRFGGTLNGEDLVVMAHNYRSHFGRLTELSEGAEVFFSDMDGNTWQYTVAAKDILPAEAVEEMTAGEYDLTLFTCATNRSQRVTIRCNKT